MKEKERWMVLVGPGCYDVFVEFCQETAKLYTWAGWRGRRNRVRKATFVGVVVSDNAEGVALQKRILQEREQDFSALRAYHIKQADWHSDNPRPLPRLPLEVLAAVGVNMEVSV